MRSTLVQAFRRYARSNPTDGSENWQLRSDRPKITRKIDVSQLFAAGWSAGFEDAIALAARKRKITLPSDLAIDAEVDLNVADGGYFLSARLYIRLPGLARELAQTLVNEAHEMCSYSKATRGNINVTVNPI